MEYDIGKSSPSTSEPKQEKILDLSYHLKDSGRKLIYELDEYFEKGKELSPECEEKPRQSNVLDEAIDNLLDAIDSLNSLGDYLSRNVINKIV